MSLAFELTDNPNPDDLARLGDGLSSFNAAEVGPSENRALAVFLRDTSGFIVGGLSGGTAWGWLHVQWLWLDEPMRGRGLAAELLNRAEAEAISRGCHGAWIDTFNPHALKAYQNAGYEVFGVLEDFPMGRNRSFLRKRLDG